MTAEKNEAGKSGLISGLYDRDVRIGILDILVIGLRAFIITA